jgi:L-erythrulose 1-phosphate isomerase
MRSLVGTSWKMNMTSSDARRYCIVLRSLVDDIVDRELFVLPPFTAIWAARETLEGSNVAWGAQHVHPGEFGACTGDISAPMLADLGCTFVEVGHAERRSAYGETDEFVADQVGSVQRWGMTAIVCVGEHERLSLDETIAVVTQRLDALGGADPARLVIAYEPEWAIGVGSVPATPQRVQRVHEAIRESLDISLGGGPAVPVIYGGSVDAAIAADILAEPAVGGLFVGRSALDPSQFARIAHIGLDR